MANNERQWINTHTLKSKLLEVKELMDKNLNNYLVLKLEKLDGIFVFHSNVKENRWIELKKDKEYTFTIGENDKGYLNLIEFSY